MTTAVGRSIDIKITILITFISMSFSAGCIVPQDHQKSLIFSYVNSRNSQVEKAAFEIKTAINKDFDSVTIFKNRSFWTGYNQKVVKGGIYRKCRNTFILTHSFVNTAAKPEFCLPKAPFLNRYVSFMGSKTYKVKHKPYKIYHFAEHNDVDQGLDYDSYYLESVGFICYYNFDKDDYILCDSTSESNLPIKEIGNQLTMDSTFFAKHTLKKLFPKYYRNKKGTSH